MAAVLPREFVALATPGYEPKDDDERGLWYSCEKVEAEIAGSVLRIQNRDVENYVNTLCSNLMGRYSFGLRVYVLHTPDFNASMFPNGMIVVNTGLLARIRSEAQLASVLGHECGHYLMQHSVLSWRDQRRKAAISAWINVGSFLASGLTNNANWYNIAYQIDQGLIMSIMSYSRAHETEADGYGLKLITDSGYPPEAAAEVWSQLIEERRASAKERKKKFSEDDYGVYATHPPSKKRMEDLADTAKHINNLNKISGEVAAGDDGRERWKAAIAPVRFELLEEQVKQNDPGASLFLLNNLAVDGWDGVLRHLEAEVYRMRGEKGDSALAAQSYAAAVEFSDAPPAAFRGHGYALLRSGQTDEGKKALQRYLELDPRAADAEVVRATISL